MHLYPPVLLWVLEFSEGYSIQELVHYHGFQ